MGRRYAPEEIQRIQALIDEGLTNREIATRLGRSEAGIRNIRHRTKLEANTTKSIQSLQHDKKQLSTQVSQLQRQVASIEARRGKLLRALQIDEEVLNQRLHTALWNLKDTKPELFQITVQDQLGKIAVELTGVFIKWLTA